MRKIILMTEPSAFFSHFVHCMEYFYWVTDTMLNDKNYMYIVMEPETESGKYNYRTKYVVSYINKITKIIPNFILTRKKYKINDVYKIIKFSRKNRLSRYFILHNNNRVVGSYLNWFPFNNFSKIRDLFTTSKCQGCNFACTFHPTHCCMRCLKEPGKHESCCEKLTLAKYKKNNKDIRIGLINRAKNRILLNQKQICDSIYNKFKIKVDVVYFEDKSFDYQINFFNKHKIIISPHGAQLCSIPFAQDNALIIECVSEGWHPYSYFSGLSYTSKKYHVMLCDDHTIFPKWWSNRYDNHRSVNRKKINIKTNPQKIINVINTYIKNSKKLDHHNCYLK